MQEIEKKNLAIARYGEGLRKACSAFCKRVGYELRVHEHRESRLGLRWGNVQEVSLTVYLGPQGSWAIIVEFRRDHVRIYPNTDVGFDEVRLSFAELSEETLTASLTTAYQQLTGNGDPKRARGA